MVVRHTPFVIRLRDRVAADSEINGVEVGVDPGSKHTGIAVFSLAENGDRTGIHHIQLNHRGRHISKALARRSAYRRRRRGKNLRYRRRRFDNRVRPRGWLAPSLRHLVDTTASWIGRLARWAPVRRIHLESTAFDVASMSTGRMLSGIEYRHGTLHGYEVREYLLEKWGRRCAYCDATGVPLNIDHVRPTAHGGSDRISNLTLSCVPCNQAKGSKSVEAFLAEDSVRLARIKRGLKKPLGDAAALNATRWALRSRLSATTIEVVCGSGARTKWNRASTGAVKTHTLDALHVGDLQGQTAWPASVLEVSCTGRGSHARTRPDRFGFPRLRMPRQKRFHGLRTGDLVRAVVPRGKHAGVHVGRVAVRASGSCNITTDRGILQGIGCRHLTVLQHGDGYGYARVKEGASSPSPH